MVANKMETIMKLLLCAAVLMLTGCLPNTYYDTTDEYVVGLRWHDRGDYESAAKWWGPLVEKGDCDAEQMMGQLYFTGRGKPQDNEKALILWRKAAGGNQQRAQWALGDLYYQSKKDVYFYCPTCSVEKDNVTALFWYKLFEKSAKYDGERKYLAHILPKITSEMSEDQIQKATRKANSWRPTPNDCGARSLF